MAHGYSTNPRCCLNSFDFLGFFPESLGRAAGGEGGGGAGGGAGGGGGGGAGGLIGGLPQGATNTEAAKPSGTKAAPTVRKQFPETWIWADAVCQ